MSSTAVTLPNEIAMQQAWRFRLWGTGQLRTAQGAVVQIVDPGKLNNGPGPDFSDAKIKVDGEVWIGAVEIHRKASDWHRHGHDGDRAYESVVLHIVGRDDCRISRPDGTEIPQAVMRIDPDFASTFNSLVNSSSYVLPMCGNALADIESIFRSDWITALAYERMYRKAADVLERLRENSGDWLQTVYSTLARGLAYGVNADNMERVSRLAPVRILMKNVDSPETVEAILFGQAGLLNQTAPADSYEALLVREYRFYAAKYDLVPIDSPRWQLSGRNPANTPFRRLALLGAMLRKHNVDIAYIIAGSRTVDDMNAYLDVELPDYWAHNYAFSRKASGRMAPLGKQSRDLLIINVLAPILFARGLETGDSDMLEQAMTMWERLPSEQNSITRGFDRHGIKANDAFTSQALIQLHREYCERRRCPDCRLGHRILARHIAVTAT